MIIWDHPIHSFHIIIWATVAGVLDNMLWKVVLIKD